MLINPLDKQRLRRQILTCVYQKTDNPDRRNVSTQELAAELGRPRWEIIKTCQDLQAEALTHLRGEDYVSLTAQGRKEAVETELMEIKAKAFQFLEYVYQLTGGDENSGFMPEEVGQEMGYPADDTDLVVQYLMGEQLIEQDTIHAYSLTHKGKLALRAARRAPDAATSYFPPVNRITNIIHHAHGPVQQGAVQSTQFVTTAVGDLSALREDIQHLKGKLDEMGLSAEERVEAVAQLATIEAQLSSTSPNVEILKFCKTTLWTLATGATGSLLAAALQHIRWPF